MMANARLVSVSYAVTFTLTFLTLEPGFIIPGLQIKTLKMTEIETLSPDLRQCLLCSNITACFFFFWPSVACKILVPLSAIEPGPSSESAEY